MTSLSLLLLPLLLSSPIPFGSGGGEGPTASAAPAPGTLSIVPATPELRSGVETEPLDWLDPSRALSDLLDGSKGGLDLLHADLLLRGVYTRVENEIEDTLASDDFTDFNLIDADVALSGWSGAWGGRVSVDLAGQGVGDNNPSLEDAYLRWVDRSWGEVTVGRFKPYMMRSSEVDPEYLLFPTRTFVGSGFDRWDEGIEWHSSFDEFDWWLSATNREDSLSDENFYALRAEWSFWDGWWEPRESAKDAPNYARYIFGLSYAKDKESDEPGGHDVFAFDLHGTFGPYSLLGEWADLDKGLSLRPSEEADYPVVSNLGANPWSLTVGRMFGEQWQAGFRVQDAKDANGTKSMGLALNWFPLDAPVVLLGELTSIDQDKGAGESGLLVRVGLSFGLSRHDQPRRLR